MSTPSSDSGDVAMESVASFNGTSQEFVPFTKQERILQLCAIDKSIQELLKSAGLAFKTLTAAKVPAQIGTSPKQARREAFTGSADTYLNGLHSVDVRMKRQINGLAECGIIAVDRPEDKDSGGPSGFSAAEQARNKAKVGLDVGWLNSRSGKVGQDMDAELWAQAKAFMEEMNRQSNGKAHSMATEDHDMDKI